MREARRQAAAVHKAQLRGFTKAINHLARFTGGPQSGQPPPRPRPCPLASAWAAHDRLRNGAAVFADWRAGA